MAEKVSSEHKNLTTYHCCNIEVLILRTKEQTGGWNQKKSGLF